MIKKLFVYVAIIALLTLVVGSHKTDAAFFKKFKSSKVTKQQEAVLPKPITLVYIYASWCPGCKNIQPTVDQIEKEFTSQVQLTYFDVSTPKNALEASKKAKELNLVDFYKSYKSRTASVGIIVQKTGEVVTVFQNNNKLEDYKAAIQTALTKSQSLENPPA